MTDKHTLVERDGLGMAMLAAWLNVHPDQIPTENRAHLNPHTMAAWQRVGEAAIAYADQPTRITALEAEKAELVEALGNLYDDMVCLINDSAGVYGLHLNGDPAEWDDLLTGFEDWLGQPMDNARATLAKARTIEGDR